MKPSLVEALQEKRSLRLAHELKIKWTARHTTVHRMIEERIRGLPVDVLPPPIGNIVAHPSMEAVLLDTPVDEVITDDMLDKPFEILSEIETAWRNDATEQLLTQLKTLRQVDNLTVDDLNLAAITFRCGDCYKWLTYPHILFHLCCSVSHRSVPTEDWATLEYFVSVTHQRPWKSTIVLLDLEMAGNIIRACGLNPETTTYQEMDELNPMLEQPEFDAANNEREAQKIWHKDEGRKPKRIVQGWRQAVEVRHIVCDWVIVY